MYELIYSKESIKQLSKLEKNMQSRIFSVLERCRIRPHKHVRKIVSSPYFRVRVGDYRVIVDIKNDQLIILVLEVGHRKKVYKKS